MYQPMGIIRALRLLLIWFIAGNMWDAAALSLWSPGSDSYKLAAITGYHSVIGWTFIASIACLVPMAAVNVSIHVDSANRTAARLAALGAMIAALMWIGMAYMGKNADLGMIRITYLRSGLEAMAFAILVGATVNDELRRTSCLDDADFGESNRVELTRK